MAIRPVTIAGQKVLRRRAQPVEAFDDALRELVDDMFDTMDAAHGVGLAAPQIGVGLRVFTWQMPNHDNVPERGVIVNPVVVADKAPVRKPDEDDELEGCLSVPGHHYPLVRPEHAHVRGFTPDGDELRFETTGWFARCMQHEYDHLNGMLYVDRLDKSWANKARRAMKESGFGVPGLTWMPGVDPDPFGHGDVDDEQA